MVSDALSTAPVASKGGRDRALIWIEGALEVIAQDGAQAIKVERLARQIGVSKGSFYWFFRDLDDLRMRAFNHWCMAYNDSVFLAARASTGTPAQRLAQLVKGVFRSELGRYDAAMRTWALQDRGIAQKLAAVDAERLALLTDLFGAGCQNPSEAEQNAHLFYRAFIAESHLTLYPEGHSRYSYMADLAFRLSTPHKGNSHEP